MMCFMPPPTTRWGGIMFRVCDPAVVCCPSVITYFARRDVYLVDGCQWNLSQIFIMWVGFQGQRSNVKAECYNGGCMHFDGVASRPTCFKLATVNRPNLKVYAVRSCRWLQ